MSNKNILEVHFYFMRDVKPMEVYEENILEVHFYEDMTSNY